MFSHIHPALSGLPFSGVVLLIGAESLKLVLLVRSDSPRRAEFLRGLEGISRVGLALSLFGVTSAFFSGYHALSQVEAVNPSILDRIAFHHTIGRATFFLSVALVGLKWASQAAKHARTFFAVCYLAVLTLFGALVLSAGYLGGELVFSDGVGVTSVSVPTDTPPLPFSPTHNEPSQREDRSAD